MQRRATSHLEMTEAQSDEELATKGMKLVGTRGEVDRDGRLHVRGRNADGSDHAKADVCEPGVMREPDAGVAGRKIGPLRSLK